MNGTIADSIIIRVGHGIMSIPRDSSNNKQLETYSNKQERLKESKREN